MQHTVLYGVVIQDAIVKGDLQEMKTLAKQGEEQLNQWGDVRAALEHLKIEIAKLEHKRK